MTRDPEPQPGDGPEYHQEHAYWCQRNTCWKCGEPNTKAHRTRWDRERLSWECPVIGPDDLQTEPNW